MRDADPVPASGLTEVTRHPVPAAQVPVSQGEATAEQVPAPAEDVIADSRTGGVEAQVRAQLAGLEARPVGEHVAAYDEVHRLLQGALARLDEG